jgi:hypothetical protein
MTFQLYAAVDDALFDESDPKTWGEPLGEFGSYTEAMDAADADLLRRLEVAAGWYFTALHVIVGPGIDGPLTAHPVTTGFGVDPNRADPPAEEDFDEAAEWLAFTRASA